jgi:quinol monooxygenase YgiN
MIRKLAEYTVVEGKADVVEAAIRRFVAAVRSHEPDTFYVAWRRGESLSFVHMMAFLDAAAEAVHRVAPYTTEFVVALYPRSVEPVRFTVLHPVDER